MGVGAGFCMYDVVLKKFTFAISSPGEFLVLSLSNSNVSKSSSRPTAIVTVTANPQ